MKKSIIKVMAFTLLAVVVCMALVSCGKTLSGEYGAEMNLGIGQIEVIYSFKGSKVEATVKSTNILGQVESKTVEGKYEINENEITFTWDDEAEGVEGGTFTFEETENGIKIGLVEYKKVEK
ncbi:MAG: hypothetical protein IKJ24_01065 [Clostridia bacterium]|nr:hypothetical protein [Clostridia bacterium]